MEQIGLYKQLTPFTSEGAGTAEWCKAEKDGKLYFVKKFLSPVYPSADLGLSEKKFQAKVARFHSAVESRKAMYSALKENDTSGVLVLPEIVMSYQYHLCTVVPFINGNITPSMVCQLSEWQRLVLMRTLTLALMNVHRAGVVHGDMKPENVLITQNPENGSCYLKLIDFDGSFFSSDPPGDIVGDPSYYPPEAYAMTSTQGVRLDQRIDIFALGIIFHYYWCGKYPDKPADQTIGECLLRGGQVTLDASIPPALQQLIQKMIAVDPNDRLPLQAVYDVLGDQIGLFPHQIINFQSERQTIPTQQTIPPSQLETEKEVEIKVIFRCESGEVLKERTLSIPYGTKQVIEAEDIKGYHLLGSRTRVIHAVSKGYTAVPVTFTYEKNSADVSEHGPKTKKKWNIVLFASLLLLGFIVLFTVLKPAENEKALNQGGNSGNSGSYAITQKANTKAPTPKPTAKPTIKPTAKTTVKPTAKTTVKPTAKTTVKPTAKTTVKPTAKTTVKPTAKTTAKSVIKATATPKPVATVGTIAVLKIATSAPTTAPTRNLSPTPVPSAADLGLRYKIVDKNSIEITDYYGKITDLVIPETLNGYTVVSIGKQAFDCGSSEKPRNPVLTSIVLPDTVQSIGVSAFSHHSTLRSVTLPRRLTVIEDDAFSWCTEVKEFVLPETLTKIGNYAFDRCYGLEKINIPKSVTKIGYSAFSWCTSLKKLVLPPNLKTIGNKTFYGCTSLAQIELPANLTKIGVRAFCECSILKSISIPSSVSEIGEGAFESCPLLTVSVIQNSTAEKYCKRYKIPYSVGK